MGKNVEIKVNLESIALNEKKLQMLSMKLINRSLDTKFNSSKGELVDIANDNIKLLTDISVALAKLTQNTMEALSYTRISFENADNSIASWFNSLTEE